MALRFNPLTALEGSFRGFPFLISRESKPGGLRGVQHEYPDRDVPYFEPLGRKAKQFDLEIYFIAPPEDPTGATADLQLAAFVALLGDNKPGTLVLPGLQREQVYARSWTPERNAGKAGWAAVSVTFVEQGRNQFPSSRTSWPHTLVGAALAARTAFGGALGGALELAGLPIEVTDSLAANAEVLGATLGIAVQLASGTAPASAIATAGLLTAAYLGALPTGAGEVLDVAVFAAATVTLMSGWADAFAGASPSADDRARAVDALFVVYDQASAPGWGLPPALPIATPTGAVELANQAAFAAAVRRLALTEAARLAASLEFASYDDAAALRERFDVAFDAEVEQAGAADGSRNTLADLQAATLIAISEAGADKARLVSYIVPRSRTAIGLAQLFYPDDADVPERATELAKRNGTIHPSFMSMEGERLSE